MTYHTNISLAAVGRHWVGRDDFIVHQAFRFAVLGYKYWPGCDNTDETGKCKGHRIGVSDADG